jgi:hypothetical protein
VEVNQHGLPVAILPLGRSGGPAVGTPRAIEAIVEVWRVDDEWWRAPICRRYVEVVLKGGKHTVLYENEQTGEWSEQTP